MKKYVNKDIDEYYKYMSGLCSLTDLVSKIIINQKYVHYNKTEGSLIIIVEISLPSIFIENNYNLLKQEKNNILNKLLNFIKEDKRFIKYHIPINFYKFSKIIVTKTGLLNITMDLKL